MRMLPPDYAGSTEAKYVPAAMTASAMKKETPGRSAHSSMDSATPMNGATAY